MNKFAEVKNLVNNILGADSSVSIVLENTLKFNIGKVEYIKLERIYTNHGNVYIVAYSKSYISEIRCLGELDEKTLRTIAMAIRNCSYGLKDKVGNTFRMSLPCHYKVL